MLLLLVFVSVLPSIAPHAPHTFSLAMIAPPLSHLSHSKSPSSRVSADGMGGAVPLDASEIVDSLLLRSFSPSSPPRSGNDASKLLRALPRRDEPPGPDCDCENCEFCEARARGRRAQRQLAVVIL